MADMGLDTEGTTQLSFDGQARYGDIAGMRKRGRCDLSQQHRSSSLVSDATIEAAIEEAGENGCKRPRLLQGGCSTLLIAVGDAALPSTASPCRPQTPAVQQLGDEPSTPSSKPRQQAQLAASPLVADQCNSTPNEGVTDQQVDNAKQALPKQETQAAEQPAEARHATAATLHNADLPLPAMACSNLMTELLQNVQPADGAAALAPLQLAGQQLTSTAINQAACADDEVKLAGQLNNRHSSKLEVSQAADAAAAVCMPATATIQPSVDAAVCPVRCATAAVAQSAPVKSSVELPSWLCSSSAGLAASAAICRASLLCTTAALARLSRRAVGTPTAAHQQQQMHVTAALQAGSRVQPHSAVPKWDQLLAADDIAQVVQGAGRLRADNLTVNNDVEDYQLQFQQLRMRDTATCGSTGRLFDFRAADACNAGAVCITKLQPLDHHGAQCGDATSCSSAPRAGHTLVCADAVAETGTQLCQHMRRRRCWETVDEEEEQPNGYCMDGDDGLADVSSPLTPTEPAVTTKRC